MTQVSKMHLAVVLVMPALLLSSSGGANATWYDSATRKPVHVTPEGPGNSPGGEAAGSQEVLGGEIRTVYWDKKCSTWRDRRTGREVHVTPRSPHDKPRNTAGADRAVTHDIDEEKRVTKETIITVYWLPCPTP